MPSLLIGIFSVISIVFLGDHLNHNQTAILLLVMVAAQYVVGYLYSQQKLTYRLTHLQQYINQVASVDEAPNMLTKDGNNDDLANIINDLSSFITNLADVIHEIRTESDTLKQGSASLAAQMIGSVGAVDESANQIEQMASSIDQVVFTSTTLSDGASQVSETTGQVLAILEQGTKASNTSQHTIVDFDKEVTIMASDLALLQEECSRIGTVLEVIDGIADHKLTYWH